MTTFEELKAQIVESQAKHARESASIRAEAQAQLDAELKTLAEAQRPEIQADFDKVREKLTATVDELVDRAQTAWDDGARLLALQFPLAPDPLPLVRHLPDLAHEYRILDETVWNDALNRIVDIGWHAHSWTIGRGDHPIPLFKRPE